MKILNRLYKQKNRLHKEKIEDEKKKKDMKEDSKINPIDVDTKTYQYRAQYCFKI